MTGLPQTNRARTILGSTARQLRVVKPKAVAQPPVSVSSIPLAVRQQFTAQSLDCVETTEDMIEFLKSRPEFEYTPGVHSQSFSVKLTNEEYHGNETAVSSSKLKIISRSLAHYAVSVGDDESESDEEDEKKSSKSCLEKGNAFHMRLLEPELFMEKVIVWLGADRRGKKFTDFVELAGPGKTILIRKDYKEVEAAAAYVLSIEGGMVRDIIENSKRELSIFWKDEQTGVWCKCRPDALNPGVILDLKSTRDSRADSFGRDASRLGYYLSAAMYKDGVFQFTGRDLPFVLLATEIFEPYGTVPYEVKGRALNYGQSEYRKNLKKLAIARANNHFPNYPTGLQEAPLPGYIKFDS